MHNYLAGGLHADEFGPAGWSWPVWGGSRSPTAIVLAGRVEEVAVSRVRVHNFSVSLDGFGTGEGQSLEAAFGHEGTRG